MTQVVLVTGGAGFIGSHLTARLLAEGGRVRVLFEAARRAGVRRVVYASSSSVYGDRPELPTREDQAPAPIPPYAASKLAGEQYGQVWHRLYGVETVGLRYFNVFGPRQDPASEYAAVIPRFILRGLRGEPIEVHGDGRQSRDFTYIDNVVDANLLAARTPASAARCSTSAAESAPAFGDHRAPGSDARPSSPAPPHAVRAGDVPSKCPGRAKAIPVTPGS